jgi:UDP-glucose 4-epimerase
MKLLVTGGTGYIGSHTLIELLEADHDVVVVDNLSNSNAIVLERLQTITGISIPFYELDIRDEAGLERIFEKHDFDAIIHFAGLKSVGESVREPLMYYSNNLDSSLTLFKVANTHSVKKIIFSSSATVYGTPDKLPLTEDSRTGIGITNPYGQTKFMIEQILQDMWNADNSLEITLLRYFNPVGAHQSGLIGEDPNGPPNNLLPYVSQVAAGRLPYVNVYGDDYDTPDGTGVRDYIHVVDLARGHVATLQQSSPGIEAYNLCTGTGTSVLELIDAMRMASGQEIPYIVQARRPGDIASCYASPAKANARLSWTATKTIEDACADAWKWQSMNPSGYRPVHN